MLISLIAPCEPQNRFTFKEVCIPSKYSKEILRLLLNKTVHHFVIVYLLPCDDRNPVCPGSFRTQCSHTRNDSVLMKCGLGIDRFRCIKTQLGSEAKRTQAKEIDHVYSFLLFMLSRPQYQSGTMSTMFEILLPRVNNAARVHINFRHLEID